MEQFNVALALDRLLPAAQYGNSLTANTEAAYNALRWQDDRPKPNWADIVAAGEAMLAEAAAPPLSTQLEAVLKQAGQALTSQTPTPEIIALVRNVMAINNELTSLANTFGGDNELYRQSALAAITDLGELPEALEPARQAMLGVLQ